MSVGTSQTSRATTLDERKAFEADRRRLAADKAVDELRSYALDHGGRFVLFGSYVAGTMRFDSDLDVMIDFPTERSADAWTFAEGVMARYRIPLDLHEARTTTPAFAARVEGGGLVLP